jgi:DNA-binding MarR family transcriptional regulator
MSDPAGGSESGPGAAAFLLAQLGGYAAGRFAERLALSGGTPPVAGLLRLIDGQPGRSQQEIAGMLGMPPSRLVALVDELEGDGLVERRRNSVDRRQYALHLTDAGRVRLGEIAVLSAEHARDLLAPLDSDEVARLGELLGRLAAAHGLTPGVHPGFRHVRPRGRTT